MSTTQGVTDLPCIAMTQRLKGYEYYNYMALGELGENGTG